MTILLLRMTSKIDNYLFNDNRVTHKTVAIV